MKLFRIISVCALMLLAASAADAKNWFYQTLYVSGGRSNNIECFYAQPRCYTWGGTGNGLFRLGYNGDTRWYYADGAEGSLPGNHILSIFSNSAGDLCINTDKGCVRYIPATDSFEAIDQDQANASSNTSGRGKVRYKDSKGWLWCNGTEGGVECHDADGTLVQTFTTLNSGLSSNIVTSFLERDREMLIGTDGGGLNVLNLDTKTIYSLKRNQRDYNSFPSSSILALQQDAAGIVWALTPDSRFILIREESMRNIPVAPVFDPQGRGSDNVLCIADGGSGKVWLGTAGSGLFSLSPASEPGGSPVLNQVPSTAGKCIESMVFLRDGRLLLSCYPDGLYFCNTSSGALSPFNAVAVRSALLSVDKMGQLLVNSGTVGVWNPVSGTVSQSPNPAGSPLRKANGTDSEYYYSDRHIYSWNPESRSFSLVFDNGADAHINSVAASTSGDLWIASDSGVFKYNIASGKSVAVPALSKLVAQTLIADQFGRIWVGSSSKVFLYLPQMDKLTTFSASEGVGWNWYGASTAIESGNRIYFGGAGGVQSIDDSISLHTTDTPEIVIPEIYVAGERILNPDNHYSLSHSELPLKVNVLVKENNFLRTKLFRFTLDTPSGSTESVSSEPSITLSDCAPGKYKLSVSATMADGSWAPEADLLSFRVWPVWYKSGYFWSGLLILLAAIFGAFMYLVVRSKNSRIALAESEAEVKTGQQSIRFFLNVSHELKTPLTLIISPLSRLLKNKDKSDPEYSTLSNIYRQANRMSRLILTVLDAHKIQEGSATLNAENVKLNQWVEGFVASFDEEADSRSIVIRRSYDENLSEVSIDAPKLENVLTNILINAFKHSPDNSTITVGTRNLPTKGMVRVYVADQGSGLGGVDMSKLFVRYYQGYAQKTGSGLGLAYANSIVELHKGSMGAVDNEGPGSTFYFDIPGGYAAPKVFDEPQDTATASRPAKDINEADVLIVDDDTDLRDYISSELLPYCKSVFTASNGRDALDVIANRRPDVVVSDVMMPVMDGFELLGAMKSDHDLEDIPVIMLTAKIDGVNRNHGLSLGAVDYLPKPFEIDNLVAAIKKSLLS